MTPEQHNVLSELARLGLQKLQETAQAALAEAQTLVPPLPASDGEQADG